MITVNGRMDVYQRYIDLDGDDIPEAKEFRTTLKNGIKKRSYPHLVDEAIKVIKLDIKRGQDASDEELRTMFHNVGVLSCAGVLLVPDAIADAVALLREGDYNGFVEKLMKTGEWERGGYADPHWTGD